MPAKSKSQQKLMGMVHAYNKGELPNASKKVKELAKSMKNKDSKDFAKTKHKGLPEHVRKKKHKKTKKSSLISNLIKLANHLDNRGLTEVADLTDLIIRKLAQQDDEESSFRIYPEERLPLPKDPIRPESDEELEVLMDTELPSVKEYREKNLYVVKAVFKDGTESILNLSPETINLLNQSLKDTNLSGPNISIPPHGPYTFKEIQKMVGLFLMIYSLNPNLDIDQETSEKIINKMLESPQNTDFLPPPPITDFLPPRTAKDMASGGELDHLKIVRYDLAKHFAEGDPDGETVATVDLEGNITYNIPEEEVNSPQPLELLLNKNPPKELEESREINQKYPRKYELNEEGEYYSVGTPEHDKAHEEHSERWRRRYEEAQKRYLEKRYPEDVYEGTETEIPYGSQIEEFEDIEDNEPF